MKDIYANWRNARWSYDADYVERENAPILSKLIESHRSMFDDIFIYIFQGKAKQYIYRFPHYNTPRSNYRIPSEKHRAPNPNRKLSEFIRRERKRHITGNMER